MKVPLRKLNWESEQIEAELRPRLDKLFARTEFIHGTANTEFEKAFSSFIGCKYTIGVSSGTDALFIALLVAGVGHGDEVITVSNTFFATVEAIVNCGAIPIFVDINADGLMDVSQIEEKITKKTKCLLPVHLYGLPADLDVIEQIADKHNLKIIHDAAQAHGTTYKSRMIGSTNDLTCFSFMPAKSLGCYGDGGAICTNDRNLYEKARKLSDHGRLNKQMKYIHELFGFCSRLDNLQAEVLNVKLKHLEDWLQKRQSVADYYIEHLEKHNVEFPSDSISYSFSSSNYVFSVLIKGDEERRERLQSVLSERGIETGIYYPNPCHLQPAYLAKFSYIELPLTEMFAKQTLSLPMNPGVTPAEQKYVCQQFNLLSQQI